MTEPKAERPVRRDAPLAKHLRARGLRAVVVVVRADNKPLTVDDVREADAALVAFEQADRRAWEAFAKANGEKAKPAKARATKAPSDARAPKRKAAKRPARARSK